MYKYGCVCAIYVRLCCFLEAGHPFLVKVSISEKNCPTHTHTHTNFAELFGRKIFFLFNVFCICLHKAPREAWRAQSVLQLADTHTHTKMFTQNTFTPNDVCVCFDLKHTQRQPHPSPPTSIPPSFKVFVTLSLGTCTLPNEGEESVCVLKVNGQLLRGQSHCSCITARQDTHSGVGRTIKRTQVVSHTHCAVGFLFITALYR